MRAGILKSFCLLALLASAPLAHAQLVYRCIGEHGEPVFSGQPCGTPAPSPGATAAAPAGTAGGLGGVCAASPRSLRDEVAAAFQRNDVNLLSGLILWNGTAQSSARATLRSLSAMLKEPLVGITLASGADPPADAPASSSTAAGPVQAASVAPPPSGLVVTTQPAGSGTEGGQTRDFGLAEVGGCWWLTL